MTPPRIVQFALAALIPALALAQTPLRPSDAVFEGRPGAGAKAGTERWVVHFQHRPFTTDALRDEYQGKADPAEVAAIIADLERRMKAHQAEFVKDVEALGGRVTTQFWLVNACAIEIAPKHLKAIRALENIDFLEPDVVHGPLAIKTGTDNTHHRADSMHALGLHGFGIAIAILDGGHDQNMNNTGRPHIAYSKEGKTTETRLLFNKKMGSMTAEDFTGHGTAVASCAAGWRWRTSAADEGHAPGAKIAGYALANNSKGDTSSSTQAAAWQQMVKDAAQNKIRVANMSYAGSPVPTGIASKASDTAVLVADVLICTAAGNSGTNISGSQVNLNGLSVGMVNSSKVLDSRSGRGTMQYGGDFPDIVAHGVGVRMAQRDNEGTDKVGDGTSFASPMVAGAATQLRARHPKLKADTIKAILLATAEASPGTSNRHIPGVGVGYLRNDLAHYTARDPWRHGRGTVSNTNRACRWTIRVKKGEVVQIAIAWNRMDVNKNDFSDLNLFLQRGTTTIARSNRANNSEEMIRYTSTANETINVWVHGWAVRHTVQQEFAWAVNTRRPPTNLAPLSFTSDTMADVGDFNRDGYSDIAVGWGNGNTVRVYSGKDHSILKTSTATSGRYGGSLAGADMDQDGYSDVIIGHPAYSSRGAIWILSGRTRTASRFHLGVSSFGATVAAAQFLDADGWPDIVTTDDSLQSLVAFSGRTKAQLWRVKPIPGSWIHRLEVIGDINNDGLDDVMIGLPFHASNFGRVEVRSGKDGRLLRAYNGSTTELLGMGLAALDDLDGDNVRDYAYSAPLHPNGGRNRGVVGIRSGRTHQLLGNIWGVHNEGRLGWGLSNLRGDVDHDGVNDICLSAGHSVGFYSGKTLKYIYLINGEDTSFGKHLIGLHTNGDDSPDMLIGEVGKKRLWLYDAPAVPNPPGFTTYGGACAGASSGLARIGLAGPPRVGQTFAISLSSGPKSSVALCRLGVTRRNVDLTAIGLPGCFLHLNEIMSLSEPTDSRGWARQRWPLPNVAGIAGWKLLFQWACIDLGKKPLPFALSNAAEVRVGGHR